MMWKERKRSRIKCVQMDSSLVDIRRVNKVLNAQIRELWGVSKGINKRIDGVHQWFSHVERMENDRIPKRGYVGSRSVSRPWKRWIDIVKECLKEKKVLFFLDG